MNTIVNQFLYRLIPPRPTFVQDMTEAERKVMQEHSFYWKDLVDRRIAMVFGPRTCGAQIIGTGFVLKYFRTVEGSIPVFVSNRHVIEASLGGEILMHRSDRNNNVIPGNIPLSVACYIFASC